VYGDDRTGVVAVSHEASLGCHQGQIGDGGGDQEPTEGLRSTEVASLARTELHQPGQPMFGGLS